MEKKQTAVEFYRTEFSALVSMKESKFQNENEIFEQAKQMHKKEIMKVVMDFGWSKEKADKYYNDTYGGENE